MAQEHSQGVLVALLFLAPPEALVHPGVPVPLGVLQDHQLLKRIKPLHPLQTLHGFLHMCFGLTLHSFQESTWQHEETLNWKLNIARSYGLIEHEWAIKQMKGNMLNLNH